MKEIYLIYGKKGCIYCYAAKTLLDKKGIDYIYRELDTDYDFSDFLMLIAKQAPDHKTFPLIFKTTTNDESVEESVYIGGYTDLKELLED